MDQHLLLNIVLGLVTMVMSLTVHEWAHAWAARRLGDGTAEEQGRLTLNPVSHIDPIGTLLLPALLAASGGLVFGWARPVPYNPLRFDRRFSMRFGTMLVAAAGPLSNLLLAVLMGLALTAMRASGVYSEPLWVLANVLVPLNVALAIFNLLPVPPLDGSKVLPGLLPERLGNGYIRFLAENPFVVPLAFFAVVWFGGKVIAWPVIVVSQGVLWITGNA